MVKRNPKQEEALMLIIDAHRQGKMISEKEIIEKLEISNSVIKSLLEKQLIEILQVPIDRISDFNYRQVIQNFVPTADQQQAINTINDIIDKNAAAVILLHGITGSGKTWVYIEIMRQIIAQDKQILYLLPEIGLTTQIIDRLKSVFGDTVGVYHSRFSSAERVEIWQKILLGHYRIIIGVRSAILLPFEELGLIIVDEEHDHSFKQQDPAPRYHARDVAVWYGHTFSIPVILGSATPSIESYENAISGKYNLVEMKTRAIINAKLPEIHTVDMRTQIKHKLSYGLFSDILIEELTQTLARKEQAILFRNRRGYAPYLVCENCGHIPQCEYCDIRLTYHKKEHYLRCHYCGYTDSLTDKCANCDNYSMKREGIGTERIEEQLQSLFPQARIQRMDQDTTRGKSGHRNIIEQLERYQIDFLVGTQMVTKGLDFENVTLVAVLDADQLIFFPDFRAHETAYQILVQFSGRAGRSNKQGKVLIQTRNPEHPVITLLVEPFSAFYENELAYRMLPNYPPYSRLIRLEFQHKDQLFVEREAQKIGKALQNEYNNWVIGPEFADVARVKNYYRMFILIKVNKKYAVTKVKKGVENILDAYRKTADDKTLKIIIDVDPY
jgi:primosomal protein N' (replication factor Y)